MFNKLSIDRINVWVVLVTLLAVSFPLSDQINSVLTILLVLHWLADKNLLNKIKGLKDQMGIILPFWLFFFIHFIFLPAAINPAEGWQTITVKLSFFLFPLLFSTENYLTGNLKRNLMWAFCISAFVSVLYCLCYYYIVYYDIYGWQLLSNRMYFSVGIMHPGYYSNYFLYGIIFLSHELLKGRVAPGYRRYSAWFLIAAFLFVLFILVSKTAVIILFVFIIYIIWKILTGLSNPLLKYGFFAGMAFLALLLFTQVPSIKNRIHETKDNLNNLGNNIPYNNSTGARLVAWDLEWELISANWLKGYGTGNANRVYFEKLVQYQYLDLQKNKMHTHNQFFHSWLDLGIAGFLLLLYFFCALFYHYRRQWNYLGFWLALILCFNCLTDDAMEIQAVVVFSLFFICILLFRPNAGTTDARQSHSDHKLVPDTPHA